MDNDALDPDVPGDSPADHEQSSVAEGGQPPDRPTLVMSDETDVRATRESIGPYHLLQLLGEGGMGEVWEADQTEPVRRRVALKVIKKGMDTKEVIARFEAERQALALMDHACIAKVFDAGQTSSGRPYFVMELVHGTPITRYCDRRRLTTRERLELFGEVCEGVQHAHQKAIIHRDLKPSNILVSRSGDRAQPKIIDFGIAKAMARPLTDTTMHTRFGVMVGTPEYMSPEQALMSGEKVDTRTDVYALGVVLYELLTGVLPFDPQELRSAGLDGIRRKICEENPPRPSTRMSGGDETTSNAADRRRSTADALQRSLKGDLDWIVMKALAKEREHRYGSARELWLDLQRHLANQPVEARPPSAGYRIGKFVSRHRVGVAAAVVVALALVVGIAGTTAGLVQARRQARRADREAAAARQVAAFLTDLFAVSDPGEARGNTVTARELLDRSAARIGGELQAQPLVRARMMRTMGEVYRKLGLFAESAPLLEEAHRVLESELTAEDAELAASLASLGVLAYDQGRYDDSEPLLLRVLAIREESLGPDHPDVAETLSNLGRIAWRRGRFEEAEAYHRRAIAIREHAFGRDHSDVAESCNNLGVVYLDQKRYAEARDQFERALEIREAALGPDHPEVARSLNNLGNILGDQGRLEEAEPLFRRALSIRERTLGPDHPDVAESLNNHCELLRILGRPDEGEPFARRALGICESSLEPGHDLTFIVVWTLAATVRDQQRPIEAEELYRRALAMGEVLYADGHPALEALTAEYAAHLRGTGREAEAAELEQRLKG